MKYCKKCVQPDTRPGIKFDDEGVCSLCRFAEDEAARIDWAARRKELEEIAGFGKDHNVSGYDCVVGVSGEKDSLRLATYVRDELGMKPLLVSCAYPPEQQTERGVHNLCELISLGFDCISVSPAPQTRKKMLREGFRKFGDWRASTKTAIFAGISKIAVAYHIPLIFFGDNPAVTRGELGAGFITGGVGSMNNRHSLNAEPIAAAIDDITEKDLFWYRYPLDEEMEWAKLRIVYLGYYVKDFTCFKNAEFAIERGLEVREDPPEDIGDIYGFEALDDDLSAVNQFFKHLKFGFGKATEQAAEAVREGMLTREEAMELVRKYDGKCAPRFIKRFREYLEISEEEFLKTVEKYRNMDIWEKDEKGEWRLRTPLE